MSSPFSSLSEILKLTTGGGNSPPQTIFWHKINNTFAGGIPTNNVTGKITSTWYFPGWPTAYSASQGYPTTSSICDRNTPGAFPIQPPVSGNNYLLGATMCGDTYASVIYYDRLAHCGGFSGASTSTQLVSMSINRWTGSYSAGNKIYLEMAAAVGTTGSTYTVNYINQDGISQTTPPAQIGGALQFRQNYIVLPTPLAAGDTGVRAIDSIKLASTTGNAGNVAIFIGRPILTVPGLGNTALAMRDCLSGTDPIPIIDPSACVVHMFYTSTNSIPWFHGSLHIVEK